MIKQPREAVTNNKIHINGRADFSPPLNQYF